MKGTERSACVKARPSAANVLAVVVDAEGVESVVNDTCAPPAPVKATPGAPSFAASYAAPLYEAPLFEGGTNSFRGGLGIL